MPRYRRYFNVLVLILLGGCSLGRAPLAGKEDAIAAFREGLLLINSLSEDFSVVSGTPPSPQIRNGIKMHPEDHLDEYPCQGPNDVQLFEGHLYVTCSLSQDIHVFSKDTLKSTRVIRLEDGSNPWQSVIVSAEKGYVSSYLKDALVMFNPSPLPGVSAILGKVSLSHLQVETDAGTKTFLRPTGMVAVGHKLYVALANLDKDSVPGGPGYIAVIDTRNDSVLSTVKTAGRNTLALFHTSRAELRNRVFAISAGNYQQGESGGYAGDGTVDLIDSESDRITETIRVGGAPFEMVIDDKGVAYLSNGKEGKILRFNALARAPLPSFDLRGEHCGVQITSKMSYISSLAVQDQSLYATEFNSNCFLLVNTVTGKISHELKAGDGPELMLRWQ